jgi:hypothetical protein
VSWAATFHEIIVAHVETARMHGEPWHVEELAEELAERVAAADHAGAVGALLGIEQALADRRRKCGKPTVEDEVWLLVQQGLRDHRGVQ